MSQERNVDPTRPDVLVIGAGPSGSALSLRLARRGWRVTVIDRARFPRPKPCGEFISPGAVRALARLGFPPGSFAESAAQLRGWSLQVGDRSVSAEFSGNGRGFSLPRSTFDHRLLAQARAAGAQVHTGTRFVRCSHWAGDGDPGVEVRSARGLMTLRPRVLVGAGGLRCPVAAQLDVSKRPARIKKVSLTSRVRGVGLRPDMGRLFVRGDLTIGLAPSDPAGDEWNATVVVPSAVYGRRIARGAVGFFHESLARAGVMTGGTTYESDNHPEPGLWASGPFDRPTATFHKGRIVLVGDAGGYFDPFTGQGIYQALRSAEVLGAELSRALSGAATYQQAFESYGRIVERERSATTRVQRAVEWALSEGRQDLVMRGLARTPGRYGEILDVTTDTDTLWKRAIRLGRRTGPTEAAPNVTGPPVPGSYVRGPANQLRGPI
ncbi:MAG: NAD(P)/FAD-dependent oxidoreductase [Longimicrobiales bacterium]